jgi:hypothetical protein
MFGSVRHVFASRWKALWWAAGVLLTAYCSVPSPDASSDPKVAAHEKHVNPWARGYHAEPVQQPEHMDLNAMLKKVKEEQRRQAAEEENPWKKKPADNNG